jgi:2-desacetyl-2-hydroxyethyl bacteriochlorophyllide A dehydrogenase
MLMRALVYEGPKEMNIRQVQKPVPEEGEVLIRVAYSGICGSELSGYLGKNALRRPPLIFGHEFSGTIEQIGGTVSGLTIGQRVTANPLVTCGKCEKCISGRQQLCVNRKLLSAALPGSNAEFVKIPASFVYPIPDSLDLQSAALTEPVACAVRSVELAAPKPKDSVLIIGMGPIGLLALRVFQLYGVSHVIAVDMNRDRLELARRSGATTVLCPTDGDVVELIKQITGGRGVDIALDAVGADMTRQQCIVSCTTGGRVVLTGLHAEESVLPVNLIIRNEIQLLGAFAYSTSNFQTALRWLSEGGIVLGEGVVEAPLAEGAAWFEALLGQSGTVSKISSHHHQ